MFFYPCNLTNVSEYGKFFDDRLPENGTKIARKNKATPITKNDQKNFFWHKFCHIAPEKCEKHSITYIFIFFLSVFPQEKRKKYMSYYKKSRSEPKIFGTLVQKNAIFWKIFGPNLSHPCYKKTKISKNFLCFLCQNTTPLLSPLLFPPLDFLTAPVIL